MKSQFRTVSEVALGDSDSCEKRRIRKYINTGLPGKFNLSMELKFIRAHKEVTTDMHSAGYIDDTRFQIEMMMLSARYLMLECYQQEMFNRYSDIEGEKNNDSN